MKFCKLCIFVLYFYARLCIINIVSLFNCLTNTILQKHENDKNCRYFVLNFDAKKGEEMVESSGQLLKSIGFPIPVLDCVDKYVAIKGKPMSRSSLVITAVKEYIKKHNLEEITKIKI